MGVTYRYQMRSQRTDGEWVVAQDSAAVYGTPEEALLQAGTDELIGANVHPVDVIEGEHHGYDRDAADADAKVLAGRKEIRAAAKVVRELWTAQDDQRSIAASEADLAPLAPEDHEAVRADAREAGWSTAYAHTAARARLTFKRLGELL